MYNVAFFFHIIGAILLISGIVLAGVAFETARRRQGPGEIALLLSLTRAGVVLVAVGSLLAGGFGLWLVHLGRWGYGTGWVDASIVLYLAALALGGFGGQRPKQARLLAARLARDAKPASAELRTLLDDRASLAANYASLALMVAIIALMCFKP